MQFEGSQQADYNNGIRVSASGELAILGQTCALGIGPQYLNAQPRVGSGEACRQLSCHTWNCEVQHHRPSHSKMI